MSRRFVIVADGKAQGGSFAFERDAETACASLGARHPDQEFEVAEKTDYLEAHGAASAPAQRTPRDISEVADAVREIGQRIARIDRDMDALERRSTIDADVRRRVGELEQRMSSPATPAAPPPEPRAPPAPPETKEPAPNAKKK